MGKMPLVTIITPTYNRAGFLVETIESVLRQDYANIEYLVLDDGSNDDTKEVVSRYSECLNYVYHENIGETETVNKGFGLAGGEVICVVNSDDPLYSESAVSMAVQCLCENPDALMAYSDWVSIDGHGKVVSRISLPDYTIDRMLQWGEVSIGPGMFIRRRAIEKVGFRDPSLKYVGDLDYSFRLASVGRIVRVPHFLATHRNHVDSLSYSDRGIRMAMEVLGLCEKYIHGPYVSRDVKNMQNRIIAEWHITSISYIGKGEVRMKLAWVCRALRLSPLGCVRRFMLLFYSFCKGRFDTLAGNVDRAM